MAFYSAQIRGQWKYVEAESEEDAKTKVAKLAEETSEGALSPWEISVSKVSRTVVERQYEEEINDAIMQDRAGRIQKRLKRMRTRIER